MDFLDHLWLLSTFFIKFTLNINSIIPNLNNIRFNALQENMAFEKDKLIEMSTLTQGYIHFD
jgi:hypothetical protein